MKTIELCPAYVFDCDDCGSENFVRGLIPSLTEEVIKELQEEFDVPPEDMGVWMCMPTQVKCSKCGAEFSTEHYPDNNTNIC